MLPVQCAGCLAWDEVLCHGCRAGASSPSPPVEGGASIPTWFSVTTRGRCAPDCARRQARRSHGCQRSRQARATLGASLWEAVGGIGTPAGATVALHGRARSRETVRCAYRCQRPRRGRRLRGRGGVAACARVTRVGVSGSAVCGCVVDAGLRVGVARSRARRGQRALWDVWGRCGHAWLCRQARLLCGR